MSSAVQPHGRKGEKPFSPFLFFVTISSTLLVVFAVLASVFPTVWKKQFDTPFWTLLAVFCCVHLANSFAEFFFHRYVLHAHPIRFLKHFNTQHELHHGLTSVWPLRRGEDGEGAQLVVVSKYPIEKKHQYEASYFPWFSLAVFIAVASPVLALAQWILPHAPVMLGGILAIAWSMSLYELIHAVEHWSFDGFWKAKITHPRFGKFWKSVYGFHVRHHATNLCNESVSGFFGIPIPDFLFGTYVVSRVVLYNGVEAEPKDFSPPKPRRPIVLLDSLSARMEKKQATK